MWHHQLPRHSSWPHRPSEASNRPIWKVPWWKHAHKQYQKSCSLCNWLCWSLWMPSAAGNREGSRDSTETTGALLWNEALVYCTCTAPRTKTRTILFTTDRIDRSAHCVRYRDWDVALQTMGQPWTLYRGIFCLFGWNLSPVQRTCEQKNSTCSIEQLYYAIFEVIHPKLTRKGVFSGLRHILQTIKSRIVSM